MKRLFILLLAALTGIQQQGRAQQAEAAIPAPGRAFSKVTIQGAVNVVLVQSTGVEEVSVEGHPFYKNALIIQPDGDEVVIRTRHHRSYLGRLTVYVPVSQLHTVNISAHARLTSKQKIYSSLLNVYINSDCSVKLDVLGRINIIEGAGFSFVSTGSFERPFTDAAEEKPLASTF